MANKADLTAQANERGITLRGDETNDEIQAAIDAADPVGEPIGDNDLGVATAADNADLEHTDGGVTTRDDANDLGVPMVQGDASERQGPEDAFGPGPKRGDYSGRLGGVNSTTIEADGTVVDQNARALEHGEVAGFKGGVETIEGDTPE